MLLKRLYDDSLSQASYLVGCAATGEALVIDPNRDIEQYVAAAAAEGLRITHVTETHIHADFVSGSRELAAREGATLLLSDEGDADWKYGFAAEAGATLVTHGDTFMVGNIKVEVLHTPGHTPEHIAFMITDTPATNRPMGVFTGDFVFAGDVGRPDLLEKAAGMEGTMEAGARTLYRSLQEFKRLPDYLQVWPGHGAGSACGKALGAIPSTTVGYERIANWALADVREEAFVQQVLAGQPEPPRYFASMKRINKEGPRILHGFRRPERLGGDRLEKELRHGAVVIDARPAAEYAVGFVPGTINIPLEKSFTTWAGWLVPYDTPFYLLVDHMNLDALDEAVRDVGMIGLDRLGGWFGLDAIRESGVALGTIEQVTVGQVARDMPAGQVSVVDVRGASEWEAGHIPGVPNIPLGYLKERLGELRTDRPVVVHCQSGVRSAIAASVLKASGVEAVLDMSGGYAAWQEAALPVDGPAAARNPGHRWEVLPTDATPVTR